MKSMSKLRIGIIEDDKPVTLTIKLSPAIHRDLIMYAELMKRERGQPVDPHSLVAPMLKRFMATDRAFTKARRDFQDKGG
jgi:hypothetical protein